mmetsp:Transcript_24770/g.40073  ORF Transcript_24770/g.40073 Transcript_24770/m.40073 type:complete len:88 (+) Transcript_24770:800-1063(+)
MIVTESTALTSICESENASYPSPTLNIADSASLTLMVELRHAYQLMHSILKSSTLATTRSSSVQARYPHRMLVENALLTLTVAFSHA